MVFTVITSETSNMKTVVVRWLSRAASSCSMGVKLCIQLEALRF